MSYTARLRPDPEVRVEADGSVTDLVGLDRDAGAFLAALPQAVPGDTDLSSFTTETDQLRLNACAGNGTGDSIELLNDIAEKRQAARDGRPPLAPVQVSRLFIYNLARERMGELHVDDGTYIRACFDVLSRFGVCEESLWPYDEAKVFQSPSMLAQRRAVGNRVHGYYKIKDNSSRLDQIVTALRADHPVVFGTKVSRAFMALQGDAPQGPPTDPTQIAGGHAMMIVGYFQGVGFLVKNSWGRRWGANGFCIMTPDYLDWKESFDFWVPTLGADLRT